MNHRIKFLLFGIGVLTIVSGCLQAQNNTTTPVPDARPLVTDMMSFIAKLQETGATIGPGGDIYNPLLNRDAQVVSVNGEGVQIFQYADPTSAEAGARSASTGLKSMEKYHLYQNGTLLVLYTGNNTNITEVLTKVLGPQFSGN